MDINPQLPAVTGFSEEEIRAEAIKVLAKLSSGPEFDPEDTRNGVLVSIPLTEGPVVLPAACQYLTVHVGRAWFLRVGRTVAETETAAINTALETLFAARNAQEVLNANDAADEADALVRAIQEADEDGAQ